MKKILFYLLWTLSLSVFAQVEPQPQKGGLRITSPINRMVFQQNDSHQATVAIAGQLIGRTLYNGIIEYRITKVNTKSGIEQAVGGYTALTNFNISNDISSQYLKTFILFQEIDRGTYHLEMRVRRSGSVLAKTDILFGVGDVYLIAGQSNASGYEDNNDQGIIQNAQNYTAYHGISVIDRPDVASNSNSFKIGGLPINTRISNSLSIQKGFSKLEKTKNGAYSYIYPKGQGSWCWGPLSEKLIDNQVDTPIMFFNTAQRGSDIRQWSDKYWRDEAGNLITNPPCNTIPCPRPDHWVYNQFRSALQTYGHITGLKAILWHQGEDDARQTGTNFDYYTDRMNEVIGQSRTDIGSPNLSWLSSQVSYYVLNGVPQNEHSEANPTTLNLKQQAVWNSSNKKFEGIFTDDLGANTRNSVLKIHFTGETHLTVGNRWYDKQPSQAIPISGQNLLNLSIDYFDFDNSYRLTAPSGYDKYFWVENDNGIYTPLNSNLSQSYYDVPSTQAGQPKFITCYVGESTGEPIGNATDGWNLKLHITQPFIIPGYQNTPKSLIASKSLIGYASSVGENSFVVSASSLNWEATTNDSWVSLLNSEVTNGSDGNYLIKVNATANTSTSTRIAYINLQEVGGGLSQTIEIYQEGTDDCDTPLNLVSPQNDYSISITKKTATTIQATNKITGNANIVSYKAGNSITLNAGFKVDNGTIFNAQIEGCTVDVPWQTSIIGNISGNTTINDGILTIDGTGNVNSSTDNIQFYNKPFSGNVTVIARITDITTISGMRGGIMIRSNTNQDSKMYEFILDGNANIGKLKRRNIGDNADFLGFSSEPTSNTWLRMTKIGNTIQCHVSLDGADWHELVGNDIQSDNDLGTSFLVGFVGYNSGNVQNCVVSFDNMSVNGVPVN